MLDGVDALAAGFDTVAELYEQARPSYPAALFDDLAALTGPPDRAGRVLEVGPGTGQATRGLLRGGWTVDAVEPGHRLAAVARRVLAGLGEVRVHVAPFETWEPGDRRFDLVFAATAWHWLDPAVAHRKAAGLLRPGGHLAVVSTEHVLPRPGGDDFFVLADEVYRDVGLDDGQGPPFRPEEVPAPETDAITSSGHFGPPVVRRYLWSQRYTEQEYLRLLGTYSGHLAATDEQRRILYARLGELIRAQPGGAIHKHYLNVLHVAEKLDRFAS